MASNIIRRQWFGWTGTLRSTTTSTSTKKKATTNKDAVGKVTKAG